MRYLFAILVLLICFCLCMAGERKGRQRAIEAWAGSCQGGQCQQQTAAVEKKEPATKTTYIETIPMNQGACADGSCSSGNSGRGRSRRGG